MWASSLAQVLGAFGWRLFPAICYSSTAPTRMGCGGVPEWPKGADCKSAAERFVGSNPTPATAGKPAAEGVR